MYSFSSSEYPYNVSYARKAKLASINPTLAPTLPADEVDTSTMPKLDAEGRAEAAKAAPIRSVVIMSASDALEAFLAGVGAPRVGCVLDICVLGCSGVRAARIDEEAEDTSELEEAGGAERASLAAAVRVEGALEAGSGSLEMLIVLLTL